MERTPLVSGQREHAIDIKGANLGESSPLCNASYSSYLSTCQDHQIRPCADALIRLELGSPKLAVEADADRQFGNLELKALTSLLELDGGSRLQCFTSLDLSQARLGVSGSLLVARLLENPKCVLTEVDLSFQPVGPEGAREIAKALRTCKTIKKLKMKTCQLGNGGSQAFVELLSEGREAHSLEVLDLQNNFIDYPQCHALYKAASDQNMQLVLQGNRVMDEVFNAITHGLGFVACIFGTVYLGLAVQHKPSYYAWGVGPYCFSMLLLFLSSCLYHSFHALGRTVNLIFCILDHCGIYLLIAGTYTPFLVILMHGKWWANYFLALIWSLAFCGLIFTTLYHGDIKMHIENAFYLIMGWSCLAWIHEAFAIMDFRGSALLVVGGLLYTMGVPWFVKDGHTLGFPDHVTWHLFVLAACCCHFFCIYLYVVPAKLSP
eukprot:TRINITY_DN71739_c0_g1_i1.p1 TRINITY_DN71739_c0_g1~~TRINITY_DN71739_c0_g1_i1.p1  ORF type:complete len:452 (+),score=32.91 TRINITY_DN71739_c0_g1_i1:53-1357(+)